MSEVREAARVVRSWVHSVPWPPEAVFALLCPVRERDWVPGWDCRMVHSLSGYAEKGCIFTTTHHGDAETVWTVVDHEPPRRVRFLYVTPGEVVVEVEATVAPEGASGATVSLTYVHTALSEAGARRIAGMTEPVWAERMAGWERAMNHYLETGRRIAA